jgi:hypothetical protein
MVKRKGKRDLTEHAPVGKEKEQRRQGRKEIEEKDEQISPGTFA